MENFVNDVNDLLDKHVPFKKNQPIYILKIHNYTMDN